MSGQLFRLFVCTIAAAVPLAAQDAEDVIQIEDLFRIERVGSPRISPDGEWVAYTVSRTVYDDERVETGVYMVPVSGGDAIRMTAAAGSAGSPRWSPDGRYLSFTASRDKSRNQVWLLNRQGGEAQQLTGVEQGIGAYSWSPDGLRLLLSIRDAEDTEDDAEDEPWVVDRLQFKRDNAGYLDSRRTHLYVFEVETKSLTQITSGAYDEGNAVWSPDGQRIAFVSNRTEEPDANSNSDIWIVAADNTDKGQTLLQVTTNPGADRSPAWSPDGETIAYITTTQPELIWYATSHLATIPAAGGEPRLLLADLDRNVNTPVYSQDGRTIYFGLEDSGERHLASVPSDGGRMTRVIDGQRRVSGHDLHSAGLIAVLINEPHTPNEVFIRSARGELTRLTNTNPWLESKRLAAVRNVQFNSADGTEIEGFIFTPPGYQAGLRYPTLLRIHGGPVSQYDFSFNFEAQLFAARGYIVVMANPRGSSGYGQEFSRAIWADWGNKDFQDVMAGIDFAIAEGYADPERLGVGGWSYGGILTNYVITQTDRFKGAITGASEVLYRSNYGHDHYQRQWEAELGLPWVTPEAWERISPFNKVADIVTPTLIMGGEKDWNVPILNSEQLYQALRRLDRTTQLVVYPGESHGIRNPVFQKDRLERYLEWYDRYVRGSGGRPVSDMTGR